MSADTAAARAVRHLAPPRAPGAWLHRHRFTLARRTVQAAVLLAFFATAHWGAAVLGQPLLAGNLSAAKFMGVVPLADPFAVLQMLAARHAPATEVLMGAVLVLLAYALVGARTFCAWVCPVNAVTDAAAWARARLPARADAVRVSPATRYAALGLTLVVSCATGVAAFEAVSPIGFLHREIVFGAGFGLAVVGAVFAYDLAVQRRGFCGHLCPLGAFYALAGRGGQLAVRFDAATCTRCGDCVRACPEPRVLHFTELAARGRVVSGECQNCGKCIAVCPEGSLAFGARLGARPPRPFEQEPTP